MAPDMLAKDHTFSCPTTNGIVPPGEKKFVSVFFHPETLDIRTIDYLSIMPSGCASHTLLKVVGFCRGTGNPRMLPGLWGPEQPAFRAEQGSLPTFKGVTHPCPSAWVSGAPWWAPCGISFGHLEIRFPLSSLVTWRSAQVAGVLGLSSPAFCLQAALPSTRGTLSETSSRRLMPQPHTGAGPAHKSPISYAQALRCPCSTAASTSAGSTSGRPWSRPCGLRTSQTAQPTSSLPLTAKRVSSTSDLPLGPWWARPA